MNNLTIKSEPSDSTSADTGIFSSHMEEPIMKFEYEDQQDEIEEDPLDTTNKMTDVNNIGEGHGYSSNLRNVPTTGGSSSFLINPVYIKMETTNDIGYKDSKSFKKRSNNLLGSQAQELVLLLLNYFKQEKENGGPIFPVSAVRERVAVALNISMATIARIQSKVKQGIKLTNPKRTRIRKAPITDIDGFTKYAIRNVLLDMFKNREHITIVKLQARLKEKDFFKGSTTSLWKLLHDIGFKSKKDDAKRKLIEFPHIALKRINFLKEYSNVKNKGTQQLVFLDDTLIYQDSTVGRSWQNDFVKKIKTGTRRYTVFSAATTNGFMPGVQLIFNSAIKDLDCQNKIYLNWFETQVLPNLTEPSVIILEYNSGVINTAPTTSWKKVDIESWLNRNDIPYDNSMLKIQLLHLVSLHKPAQISEVDRLAELNGHQVLRLPPLHCMFNPFEHVWAIVQINYRDIVTATKSSVNKTERIWRESLSKVTPEIWRNTIQHTDEIIKCWWERELFFDKEDIEPLIINFSSNDNEEEDEDDDMILDESD